MQRRNQIIFFNAMRRFIGFALSILLLAGFQPANAQLGGLLKKATDRARGTTTSSSSKAPSSSAATLLPGKSKGKTYYVSKNTGNNRNDGSKGSPFKNLQKAIDVAADGDQILCAEGNYIGMMDRGFIEVKKAVEIYGGYSTDFATRDILKHRSTVAKTSDKNKTSNTKSAFTISEPQGDLVIDGFLFDNGESNFYKSQNDESCPKGCLTGRIGGIGEGNPPTCFDPFIKGRIEGTLTVRNCAFVNNASFGVQVTARDGVTIDNCIFVALQMAAVECYGSKRDQKSEITLRNSTILFLWPRTKTFEDMGYGIRWRAGTNITIENNIIGGCYLGGIDFGHVVNMKSGETSTIKNNVFFANTGGDMNLPAGNTNFLHIFAEDFGDVEQLTHEANNSTLKNPQGLKSAIDAAYLEGFLNASSKASNNFDRNSPANQFRSAMGMNLSGGTETIKVSMFNNKYPFGKALELFGAMKGVGAQRP